MPQNIESLYGIEVYTPAGVLLADITGLAQLRDLQVKRNRGGSAQFDIDLEVFEKYCRDMDLLPFEIFNVNVNEVRIRRGTRYLWGGQISYAMPSLGSNSFTVNAIGFLDLFEHRMLVTERIFTATDRGTIAQTLIEESQARTNGDFGIDTDAAWVETIGDSDRTYPVDSNVKELLINLTEVIDGHDMEFTPDKKFYVYAEQGTDLSDLIKFEYPGNIKNIEFERNGQDMANNIRVYGNGINTTRANTTYQSVYKVRDKKLDFPSIINATPLENHGDEELRINAYYKDLIVTLEIDGTQEPYIGSYWLGDRIKVIVNNYQSFAPVNEITYKIDGITINIDQNLAEVINLELSLP